MVLKHLFVPETKCLKNNVHTPKGKKANLKSFTLAKLWGGEFKYKIIVTLWMLNKMKAMSLYFVMRDNSLKVILHRMLISDKGKMSNSTVKNSGSHHLNQVIRELWLVMEQTELCIIWWDVVRRADYLFSSITAKDTVPKSNHKKKWKNANSFYKICVICIV